MCTHVEFIMSTILGETEAETTTEIKAIWVHADGDTEAFSDDAQEERERSAEESSEKFNSATRGNF